MSSTKCLLTWDPETSRANVKTCFIWRVAWFGKCWFYFDIFANFWKKSCCCVSQYVVPESYKTTLLAWKSVLDVEVWSAYALCWKALNLQYTKENYYTEFISCPSYPAITTTYFMSNISTSKNPINLKIQHNRNQSRSGSEVHLRKVITNLRFSRFKIKKNPMNLGSHPIRGVEVGFSSRVKIGLLEKDLFFSYHLR